MSRDGTGSGAEVEGPAVVREQRGGAAGQRFGLASGDVDAGRQVQRLPAESQGARDPRRWFTTFPPADPSFEGGGVGCRGDELGRLSRGVDATGRDEPLDDCGTDGIGS